MIDLKNYEEWFLLYADNELSASEKQSVMAFIKLYPELNPEMERLLSLKYHPDKQLSFPDKTILFRVEEDEAALFTFSPDHNIVYPNKSSLYRHLPVKRMGWMKPLAVAASLLFMIGMFWWTMQMNGDAEQLRGYSQGIGAAAPLPSENPVKDIKLQIDHNRDILANQNTHKAGKYEHSVTEQDVVLVSSESQEIVSSIHSAEPVISLSSEQQSVSVQSNLSPELVEAARLRLSSPIHAEPFQAGLTEAAVNPVNTALLIEDAVKDEEQNIFRGLIRRLNRVIHDETDEPDRKFIQVANFQIPVKN
ncbi:MAG: hypothetical protein RLZZ172_1132 [Bacteroidota bacterium]|jgi:hypothetical protein